MNTDTHSNIRKPAVAGKFYPEEASKLAKAVDYYLEDAVAPSGESPLALIAPHAGYIYSGQIAADAFNQAAGHDYDVVVLLGTNHTTPGFSKVSVYPKGGYETPLGIAKIDEAVAEKLLAAGEDFTFEESVHVREHSIEVQVPFVQRLFPKARIVPAIVGNPKPDLCIRFGEALAAALQDRKALIVSSSDLSHYPDYKDAGRVDGNTLDAILKMDPHALQSVIQKQEAEGVRKLDTCACGVAPIMSAMTAAKKLGANCARRVSYANSGDASVGSHDRVVGYGAVAFAIDKNCTSSEAVKVFPPAQNTLNRRQKTALLTFARETIRQFLDSQTTPLARGFDPALQKKQGAFVTLKKNGQLRGCIGHMAENLPLCQVVGKMALQAAFNDRRFSPLRPKELPDTELEISVLTPFQRVGGPENILVGRDGVLIRKAGRSAVFLPQVAPEQGWNRDQMLSHLCRKAGLSPDTWKEEGIKFFTFQAIVFSESEVMK